MAIRSSAENVLYRESNVASISSSKQPRQHGWQYQPGENILHWAAHRRGAASRLAQKLPHRERRNTLMRNGGAKRKRARGAAEE
jgi:hypothetical protein